MALPIFNIPVLTGEVAEKFIEQCEYNSKYLAGSEWSQEREDRFNKIIEKFNNRKKRRKMILIEDLEMVTIGEIDV